MKWTVKYTEAAQDDLRGVYEYIAFNLLVPNTARKQLKDIIKVIEGLDTNPQGFPVYNKEPLRSNGIRFVTVNNYIVFYYPDEVNQEVSIIRIMYGGRNIEEQFNN